MRDLQVWEKIYYSIRSRLSIPYSDFKYKWPLGFLKRLRMWKMGFIGDKYIAYDFSNNKPDKYLSDYQQVMARFINAPFSEILNNKLIFEKMYSSVVKVPKNYLLINDGKVFKLDSTETEEYFNAISVYGAVERLCRKYGRLVLKPMRGALGRGILIVTYVDLDELIINKERKKRAELEGFFNSLKLYLVTEYVEQASYSKLLYPLSANTMRILTMINPEDNQPFITAAVKRIGTDLSAPVDNNSIGGISASINLETGELGSASQFTGTSLVWHDYHPNSGAKIKGTFLPNWPAVKDKVLEIAGRYPFIKYVGWDILDQDNGIVALEGNNHQQFRLLQIHKPILLDPRAVNFYRYHKIIR